MAIVFIHVVIADHRTVRTIDLKIRLAGIMQIVMRKEHAAATAGGADEIRSDTQISGCGPRSGKLDRAHRHVRNIRIDIYAVRGQTRS